MTISLKHSFTSPKADGTDSTLVQPSNWNAEHTITLAAGKVLGRDSSGAGAMQELPISVDSTGQSMIPPSGTTAQRPGTAAAGMLRYNTTLAKIELYNGSAWGSVGGGGATVSDTAPSSPAAGDLWWKSDEGQMYVYYNDGSSSQWVIANAFTNATMYLPLSGGNLTGPLTISGVAVPAVAPGTTGNVLTSNGTTWISATPATGSLTLLATLNTTSGTTQVASSLPTTYANLLFVINAVGNSTSPDNLTIEASVNNGSTWGTARSISQLHSALYGLFTIGMANTSTTTHPCTAVASGQPIQQTHFIATATAGAINAIRFTWISGYTFNAGTIQVFGWN